MQVFEHQRTSTDITMAIPKTIHQTLPHFLGIPEEIQRNIRFLRNTNPAWTHRLYDDKSIKAYLKAQLTADDYRQIERVNPKYGVVLADLFRYLVIYNEGGVYLDIKSTAKLPLDSVLQDSMTYLLSQWRNKKGEEFDGAGLYRELGDSRYGGEFQQWHVIARPNHPFLKRVIERAITNIRSYTARSFGVGKIGVLRLTGPICYTLAIVEILREHDFQKVDIQNLGFQYSIYRELGDRDRHTKNATHYSRQKEPIVFI
jgi:mannosyltransferase OCH1-like enzyme